MVVYLNGEFVAADRAAIPIDDPGFLQGEGVYETAAVRKGRLPFWEDHWGRLCDSARALGMEVPLTFARATDVLRELVRRNDLPDAVVRFQLTGGVGGPPGMGDGRSGPAAGSGARTLLVQLSPLPIYPPEEVLRGWKIVLSRTALTPFLPRVKHTNRLPHVLARREAARANAQEAILVDPEGVLLEGTRSSLFFILRGVLHTPALDCGILAGVTRDKALLVARREGMTINEGLHSRLELEAAEEVFLTFTSAGVMPVTDIEGRPVGAGRMGAATRRLKSGYDELLSRTLARVPAYS